MSRDQADLGLFESDTPRSSWREIELADICEIDHNRLDPQEFPEEEFLLYSFSAYDEAGEPDKEQGENIGSAKYELKENCLLLSKLNPRINRVWKPKRVTQNSICSTEFVVLSTEPELVDYVYALLNSPQFRDYLKGRVTGTSSSHQRVRQKDIITYEFEAPPKSEMKKIGETYAQFDDKIDTNNRINALLEGIAQTLYKSWFIDFDPYNEFKNSELGEIPLEFEVAQFADLCETYSGGPRINTDDYIGDKYKWLTAKDISSNSISTIYKTERKLNEKAKKDNVMTLMEPNSVLLTSRATIGEVIINKEPMATNQGYICMEPAEGVPAHYLLHLVNSKKETIKNRATGSTYPEISQSEFETISVPLAPKKDRIRYDMKISMLYDYMYHKLVENDTLVELRDTILPKLMSGKIRLGPDTDNKPVADA